MALQFAVNGDKWAVTSPAPRYDPNVNSDWNTYWTMKRLELAGTPTSRLPSWIKQQMGLSSDVTTGVVPGSGQQATVPATSAPWTPPGATPNFAPVGTGWSQIAQGIVGRWTGGQFNPADPFRSIDALRQTMMNIQPGTPLANELSRDITWLNNALNTGAPQVQAPPTWYQNNPSVPGLNGNTTIMPGPQTGTPGTTIPTTPTTPIVPGSGMQTQPPTTTIPTTSTGTTLPTGTGTGTTPTSGGTSTTTPTTNAGSSMTTPPTTGTPTYPQTPVTPQLPWIPQYESGQGPNYVPFYPTLEANPNVWGGLTDEQVQRALAYYNGMLPYAELAESSRRNDQQFAWTQRADAAALTGRQQLPNTRMLRRYY